MFVTVHAGSYSGLQEKSFTMRLQNYKNYRNYTCGHLHEHLEGHKQKKSPICEHYGKIREPLIKQFSVLAKCSSKFDCLVKEMILIKNFTPSLNEQSDSLQVSVFT